MNPPNILEQIVLQAPTRFLELLRESKLRLIATWKAAVEEAAIHETKAKLKVTLSAVVDLEDDSIEYEIAFGGRHKLSISESLADPNQPELPIASEKNRAKLAEAAKRRWAKAAAAKI